MAYELVAEVLDHSPADMDPACRMILVCIAEQCRRPRQDLPPARVHQFGSDLMRRRTGLDDRGLRHALGRLRDRHGMNVRVAIKTDRRGNPLYAVPGAPCTWVLPPLPAPPGCECQRCSEQADAQVLLLGKEDLEVREGGLTSPQGGLTSPDAGPTSPPPHTGPETGGEPPPSPPGQPATRCPEHAADADPPPCRRCGDARRAHDSWKAAHAKWQLEYAQWERSAPRCARHPTELDHKCRLCRADQIAAADIEPDTIDRADAIEACAAAVATSSRRTSNTKTAAEEPLPIGGELTATIDATGAVVAVTRVAVGLWRVTATKLGSSLYDATNHTDEPSARAVARSYCEELRQVRVGRQLRRSGVTTRLVMPDTALMSA